MLKNKMANKYSRGVLISMMCFSVLSMTSCSSAKCDAKYEEQRQDTQAEFTVPPAQQGLNILQGKFS